jgi:hypothetical protein
MVRSFRFCVRRLEEEHCKVCMAFSKLDCISDSDVICGQTCLRLAENVTVFAVLAALKKPTIERFRRDNSSSSTSFQSKGIVIESILAISGFDAAVGH